MSRRIDKTGQLIDRNRGLNFSFDGKTYSGQQGDTLASALLANGVTLVGRSFKYHRPRGVLASGADEPNALVGTGEGVNFEPNNRATTLPLHDGLTAVSQNKWPSLSFDIGALNNKLWRFFPAGFYYKMFMYPRAFWKHVYEPFIRQSAGLGKATKAGDPDRYEHYFAQFDIVVAGGGIAGLLAAEAAAKSGLRVLLAEQSHYWGGRARVDHEEIEGQSASAWIDHKVNQLSQLDNLVMRLEMQVSGSYDHGYLLATETCKSGPRTRLWRIRAGQLIAATGAIERPIAFPNNDVPGVMLASAVRDYAKLYGVAIGERIVVVTNNDDAYRTAFAMKEANIEVAAIVDVRDTVQSPMITRAEEAGFRILKGYGIAQVLGAKQVDAVEICQNEGEGAVVETITCDGVAMSGGWSPVVHLWSHCGGKLNWSDEQAFFAPDPKRPPKGADGEAMVVTAGAASGALIGEDCMKNALDAAKTAIAYCGGKPAKLSAPKLSEPLEARIEPVWIMPANAPYKKRAKAFLDFQHDVKVSDIQLASQEGFQSVEHAKRYTTLGMATDQGKTSNINGLAILADSLGAAIPDVGTTTFRPPYTPIPMGAIAGLHTGALFKPQRKTVIQDFHEAQNLKWEPVGDWKRPYTYMRDGENEHQSVEREILNTRENVGILDASTLGKILVSGPDAGKFLDLMYTNMMSTLKVGFCRYGLMCNENGFIHDDGVVARISENEFICHTTSGGSDRVHAMMEEWIQTEWWDLEVFTTNLTEHYAQIAIVGPKARRVLEALGGMDVSPEALPFMQFVEGKLGGFDVRIYRISFSGELSYEIAVRADQGRAFWDAAMKAGAEHSIMPYGTEALHVMRAEKGFIMVGDETDGTVTPLDLNMSWIVSKKKEDWLGKRGLERPLFHSEDRLKLVGLLTDEPKTVIPHAANIIADKQVLGYVTSTYYSPTLGRSIAMALVKGGMSREGQSLPIVTKEGKTILTKVVDPVFYDKEGEKQNVL